MSDLWCGTSKYKQTLQDENINFPGGTSCKWCKICPFRFHTPKCASKIGVGSFRTVCWNTGKGRKKWRKGDLKWSWGERCLKVWLWEPSGNLHSCGEDWPCPFLTGQDFTLVFLLDTSQVCWDWSKPARPLCHLLGNISGVFATPPGETQSLATAGIFLSAGPWGGQRLLLRLGQTPDSNDMNITLVWKLKKKRKEKRQFFRWIWVHFGFSLSLNALNGWEVLEEPGSQSSSEFPGPAHLHPWTWHKLKSLGPSPDLLHQGLWDWGPVICVFQALQVILMLWKFANPWLRTALRLDIYYMWIEASYRVSFSEPSSSRSRWYWPSLHSTNMRCTPAEPGQCARSGDTTQLKPERIWDQRAWWGKQTLSESSPNKSMLTNCSECSGGKRHRFGGFGTGTVTRFGSLEKLLGDSDLWTVSPRMRRVGGREHGGMGKRKTRCEARSGWRVHHLAKEMMALKSVCSLE